VRTTGHFHAQVQPGGADGVSTGASTPAAQSPQQRPGWRVGSWLAPSSHRSPTCLPLMTCFCTAPSLPAFIAGGNRLPAHLQGWLAASKPLGASPNAKGDLDDGSSTWSEGAVVRLQRPSRAAACIASVDKPSEGVA
jgi:hypothetical protein